MSGSLAQAQGKELVILVGGDKAAFDRAQPVLMAMGRLRAASGDSGARRDAQAHQQHALGLAFTAAIAEAAHGRRGRQPRPRGRRWKILGRGRGGLAR